MSSFVSWFRRGCLLALAAVSVACSAGPQANAPYQLGKDFEQVPQPQTPDNPKRIKVEEFFCYCCPHCYHFDPEIQSWLNAKPADVDFVRVPNSLGRPDGEVQARAFYIAQTLGIGDKVHTPMFDAIHKQNIPMASLNTVRDLFEQVAGIKQTDFDGVANSFVVDSELRRADAEAHDYRVTSVPTLVVGGKYAVSGGSEQSLKIVDYLITRVRKEREG